MALERAWYNTKVAPYLWLLLPLHALFVVLSTLRRWRYRLIPAKALPVPVIVVGNISVGGTGKTPVTLALVEHLKARGEQPAIISRGYGGKGPFPLTVSASSAAAACGDEPLLLAQRAKVPVVVAPDRRAAAMQALRDAPGTTVLISDDGLQHYALPRQFEIAVIDGRRGLGNGWRLPIGPLREPTRRLGDVDAVIINGDLAESPSLADQLRALNHCYSMSLQPSHWRRVSDDDEVTALPQGSTLALAGIGHPQRFFDTVRALESREFATRSYADHQSFDARDAEQLKSYDVLLMTEKDAMKWRGIAHQDCYYLPVTADLPETFWRHLDATLKRFNHGA
ncbi:tetraacyldisaccharide 4'-kinase [Pseudidiomarina sp. 1APP75-32.1]|uniref:Tetraacyldisaccharide 4'-kinase n=1 Tax=Pseudidiomarina terrestris TaxID=2820060 RepID=A0AAW7QWA8_9GAMM|nr:MULTISPECIES: tetraacyldisaccharide 4'-kinase [unclassified Pseudidiomarina]MDN7124049.1 tetraacyldisaccharide 4'-kinase [Pseudidiomarina sp. 1APP75-32.1]MDN7128306.1 tetraacyldisaccharide 4'-kinase [Pseudidiomarina sp. 1APR75-15]